MQEINFASGFKVSSNSAELQDDALRKKDSGFYSIFVIY